MKTAGPAVVALELEGGEITELWPDVLNQDVIEAVLRALRLEYTAEVAATYERPVEEAEQIAVKVAQEVGLERAKDYLSSIGWDPTCELELEGGGWSVLCLNTRRS